MSCGRLEQNKLTAVSCSAVGKLHLPCHSFCTLGLGWASHFCDWEAWGSFSLLDWARVPWGLYALGSPTWWFLGSWAYFSGQTFRSGTIYFLALADKCDLPPGWSRIDIWCHVFVDLVTWTKVVFYVRPVQFPLHNGNIQQGVCRELLGHLSASKFLWCLPQLKAPACIKAFFFFFSLFSLLLFLCN